MMIYMHMRLKKNFFDVRGDGGGGGSGARRIMVNLLKQNFIMKITLWRKFNKIKCFLYDNNNNNNES